MTTITVEEVKTRLGKGEKLHLIDVREPFENAEFNIGGELIPLGKIQSLQIEDLEDLKNEEVIFYCRSGKRSATAALLLDTVSFTNTKNLLGGILEWQDKFGSK
jgi:rhodanese-related sulfurtransferase